MSARVPVSRLGQSCLAFRPRSTYWISNRAFSNSSTRSAKDKDDLDNPLLDRWIAKNSGPQAKVERPMPELGSMSKNSIFREDIEIPGYRFGMTPKEVAALKEFNKTRDKEAAEARDKELYSIALDPVPAARRSYERKLVIRNLRRSGRVGKAIKIKRTEREMTYKSKPFPTSVKKMTRLMHQIQGKTVEEALIQLRFSKKRVARDVVKGLQLARDEAIAARGMGLGAGAENPSGPNDIYLADGTRRREIKGAKGTVIELKDGSKKTVVDPTEMYVDQAWATKGTQWKSPEFRARGKVNMLIHRTTKFNVLLKEEKTRMRISDEIKKKRENKPLWLPLPDRPVTTQRQYCLW